MAGNPAHVLRYRFDEETIKKLLQIRWWDWPDEKVKENIHLICNDGVDVFITELKTLIDQHGAADRTFVYGKWHENGGRKVLEQDWVGGQTYKYGGKTTQPGMPFGPVATRVLRNIIGPHLFGDQTDDLWAHLVFYPNAESCSLGWHSDAEQGIDPDRIVSVTFLEDAVRGKRPFQVRLKKRK